MPRSVYGVLLALAMIAVIVGVDVLFLRDRFWLRLFVNIGIVATVVIVYWLFVRHA